MQFLPSEIIKQKRDKKALSADQIEFFIKGYSDGDIPDYQMSALLMAIYFNGMTDEETLSLTKTMLFSGKTIKFNSPSFKVDKHSTGGVGDKTSLILGPIVAAAGVPVPMISGRGLGHTGGTLDKLESIPGFDIRLTLEEFVNHIEKSQICFIGQTGEICPADKKIYALRDVTATVESLPLICASIMSKKLAEGIDGLVLDVKYGSGAFMKDPEKAETLAQNLMAIAKGYGKKVITVMSTMNQPLGRFAGNALEVFECVEIMKNKTFIGPNGYDLYHDTRELSLTLAAHMLHMSGKVTSFNEGFNLSKEMLTSGKALEKFYELCQIHKANIEQLPVAKFNFEIKTKQSGYISKMNTEKIGIAGIILKAGRAVTSDIIEPTAGIEFHKKIGDSIMENETLFTLWGNNSSLFQKAADLLIESVEIENDPIKKENLILKTLF